MSRRKITFENLKFFNKKTLRKYVKSKGVLLEKNQHLLTRKNINDDENSFRRKNPGTTGLVSTQELPVDNSNFVNNTFFGSAEVKVNIAFEKIINKYPFDGTFDQIERFEDRLSSFEKYVFDRFPKSRGFLRLDSSLNQYIKVKDKSGYLSQALLKGNPGQSYINPEDKSFSVELCLRVPEDSSFNQNSFVFHCVNKNDTVANGFAAFVEGFDFGVATITVNSTSFASNVLTIRDLSRTVNFTADGTSASAVRTDASNYTFGTNGVSNTGTAAVRITDAINLALSNGDLLVEATVSSSNINLKQRRRGQPINVNIDGTMTQGETPAVVGSTFTDFSKNHGETNLKFMLVSGSNSYVSASCKIKKGKWHNLNFVYDRSTSRQFLNITSGSLSLGKSSFFEFPTFGTMNSDLYIGSGPSDLVMPGSQKLLFENKSSLSASIDEFRLFHGLRNQGDIDYYARRDIFAHDRMRVLFSFNEPTGSHDNGDIVLDRSGHSLHSRVENYTTAVRDPGVIPNPMFLQDPKFNPVLFPGQIDVINLNSTLLEDATAYDMNNPNKITKLIPQHYFYEGQAESGISIDGEIIEDYSNGSNLPGRGRLGSAQIMNMLLYFMAEQLDSYKMYLDQASELLHPDYNGESGVADSFLQNLAEYHGFELPNIFGQVAQEQFGGRENLGSEFATYEKSLSQVQSIVWRRVLKNLKHIIQTKGTKDSIKALFRSSGIEPDRLFRMVEYHGKNEFRLGGSRQSITEMSTLLNFSGSMSLKKDSPRGDGTFLNHPTLISVPLSGSRIEPGFPEVSGGNVLSTGKISFHPTVATTIPVNSTLVTIKDAYDNTRQFEFTNTTEISGLPAATRATANITVSDGDLDLSLDTLGFITITSFDGTIKKYVFVQGEGAVDTGTILVAGSDTGAVNLSSPTHDDQIGGIAVRLPTSGAKQHDILVQLRDAILHGNGHNGRILVSVVPSISNGSQSITLSQNVFAGGAIAHRSITKTAGPGANYLPDVENFSGGTNQLVSRKNAAILTLSIANSDLTDDADVNDPIALGKVLEINTGSGESKKYVTVGGGGSVANGTVLAVGSNWNGSSTLAANDPRIGGIAVSTLGVTKLQFLVNLSSAISSNSGHGGKVQTIVSNPSGQPGVLEVKSVDSRKYVIASTPPAYALGSNFPVRGYLDLTVPELVSSFANTITGSFGDNFKVTTKRSSSTSNLDTIKLETRDFSRKRINTDTIQIDNANPGAATSSPYISAAGFSGGSGFVNAGNIGYENNGISSTLKDGLFTSGSWSVDAIYEFSSNLPKGKKRSLSRIISTGDSNNSNWKDKHAVLTNLVLNETGDTLTLYARPVANSSAPVLSLPLTGANMLNGQKWYVAYGRKRNDEVSLENDSMYFLRVASYNFDKIDSFIEVEKSFDEHIKGNGTRNSVDLNLFQNHQPSGNNSFSAPKIAIGKHNFYAVPADNSFLNSVNSNEPSEESPNLIVVSQAAQIGYFDGKVGHLKFWSKSLSSSESLEHARNFKSVGVDSPLINNTFSTTRSGSFGRLRLNLSTDQIDKVSNPSGKLDLVDFSQTFTPRKFADGIVPHSSGALCYGFESSKGIIQNERFDYTILSPFYDEYLDDDKIKIAGFSEGQNIKTFNSKVAPVTEILPFEREVMDNRFEIQISIQRALNEDIMNIFSSLDALDNALGQPNLQFSRDYVDLRHMRNLYFDRLTDKVNYRNFFDLFRWIDDAFSGMIEKLVPRNSDFLGINLIIESHALERYKVAYGHHSIYKGEDERDNLKSVLLVSQRSGVIRRF